MRNHFLRAVQKTAVSGNVTFVASTTFASSNTTIPSATSIGDFILLVDQRNGSTADQGTPTGFTRIFFGSGESTTQAWSYRIAQSGDAGATITLASSSNNRGHVLVFSTGSTMAYGGVFDVASEFTAGNPVAQTINTTSGTKPLIAMVGVRTSGDPVSVFFTSSPSVITLINGSVAFTAGYKIYNSSDTLQDITVDSGDGGNRNSLVSMYIQVS
jgi:hypothetical protein